MNTLIPLREKTIRAKDLYVGEEVRIDSDEGSGLFDEYGVIRGRSPLESPYFQSLGGGMEVYLSARERVLLRPRVFRSIDHSNTHWTI